ncbi:MAG: beta strand repeat-containing protein, partial [Gammaproteobacteria bacterium]
MRAAQQLIDSYRKLQTVSKSTLLSSLAYLALTAGAAGVPVTGHSADIGICPLEQFDFPNGNICSSNDIEFATALVADTQVGGCVPGQQVAVILSANLELQGNNQRFDPIVYVSQDGTDISLTPLEGGPAVCERMPLQMDWFADPPAPPMTLAITDDSPPADGDICSDTFGSGGATVSDVQLNFPGPPNSFDDPVVIECVAGPNGTLEISAMIVWDNSDPGVCDIENPAVPNPTLSQDQNRCNISTGEVPVDVLGQVTIIKSAAGAGVLPFEFGYTVDNAPVNAAGINPTNPFPLMDTQSEQIFAEIGTTGSAQIVVTEQNLPMGWSLSGISCTGDDETAVTVDLMAGQVTIPLSYNDVDPLNSQSNVTCTFTNVEATTNLTLQKEWVDAAAGDEADLVTDGVNDGMNTSIANGGSEVDNVKTVVTVGTPGEVITFSESLDGANTGTYTTGFACSGNANLPTYAPGSTTATLLLDITDTDVVCTFTNTRVTSSLTLRKEWVDGAAGDMAGLDTDGVNDGSSTSTASGALGPEVDNLNTVVTTALSGETVTLSEMLDGGNTGTYTTSFTCSDSANMPTYAPGATTADLVIDAADTAIVCTYTNTRVSSALTLVKEWVNGATNDTADLSITGANNDNSTSTASGAAGSEVDNVNTAMTVALSGETVTLSELLGGGNTGTYDTTFACTGNGNDPTYMTGDTSATLVINPADTNIVCTFTNSRETATLTLQKEWVNGQLNDTSLVEIAGINADSNTSTSSGAAGSEVDTMNTATTTIFSGETVFLIETLGVGNTGSYDVTFDCLNNNGAITYTPGDTLAQLVVDPADTDVTCTYTNALQSATLTLRKEWVNGISGDMANLDTDGVNDGMNTSTSGGVAGSEIDDTNTVVTTALAGELVTLSEMLDVGNTGSYATSFVCSDSANMPTYLPGATTATLLIDAADSDVVCTYTNTLQTKSLTLRKQWINGVMNDTAMLETAGNEFGDATSTASGAAGSEIDDINTVVTTALVGETVTLSEMLGGGNTGVYDVSFACTGNTNPPAYMTGDTSAMLLIDVGDSDIVCTYTNTVQSAGLTLRKEWVDGVMGDTAALMTDGNQDGNNTSTSNGVTGSEVDNVNTVVTVTLVGETVIMSETLGGANTGLYTTSFACENSANDPMYTPGATTATLLVDPKDTSVVCTFTNTVQSASLTLQKEWVDGAAGDLADLTSSGFEVGNNTSLATGAPGSEVDIVNTVVTTALVGETVTLSEMLDGGNTGSYDVTFACINNNGTLSYTPGDLSATLDIDAADSDIVCTFTNTRQTDRITLRKAWVDGAADDTAELTASGENMDTDTSTASGAAGSEIDDVNTAIIVGLSGETINLSEVLGGGNTGSYDVNFACTGNSNPPTYSAGATSATLLIDGGDDEIVCTFTNTRQTSSLTLRKEWFDGAGGDTADLDTDGVNDGNNTSTASGVAGSEIDDVNTVVTTALSGETVTLSETLGGGNVGTYDTIFVCANSANMPTYTPGDTTAMLEIDGADTDIVCTYTNTRQSADLLLRKEWVDAIADDTADLDIDGANATSTATGAPGPQVDNINTVVIAAALGETVTLSEVFGGGNFAAYDANFTCTGNANAPTYTPGDTSATLV